MMTLHLRLKTIVKPKHTRLKFDLEKLKDPNVLETFQAMIGGKFAPLTIMNIVRKNNNNNNKNWVTAEILDQYDKGREIKGKDSNLNELRNTGE